MDRERLKEMHINWQITDFDDDIVGLCYEFVHWMREVYHQSSKLNIELSKPDSPNNFYKLQPHFPRMESRRNLRSVIAISLREENDNICLTNLFTALLAGTYVYHMPSQLMYDIAISDKEFTREASKQLLLDDTMSPNWLKEPSGRDFTALYEKI